MGLAPKTVNVDVKIIRGTLNAARRQGLIPTNPAEAVELPEAISMERGTFITKWKIYAPPPRKCRRLADFHLFDIGKPM